MIISKGSILIALVATQVAAGAQAYTSKAAIDEKYFTLKSVQIEEIAQPDFQAKETSPCDAKQVVNRGQATSNPGSGEVDIREIINIGQTMWRIVQENKPVVTVNVQRADAVPSGVRSWLDLECWQAPKMHTFRVIYKNLYGMTVINMEFRLSYSHGGRWNGVGKYLSQVTVLPSKLDVAWGYKLDANVVVVNTLNIGTQANPLAAMQLDVKWAVSTAVKYTQTIESFYVRGDGVFKKLN
ncbi:MAG: hypothetical protein COT74_10980 [Bdellovibrionales bacterium CG10_big_fil_rev_8_21_14_0_10_45_34]|nr:MAG: hypothetical protein COT74_10980 [Bdellovibrionales bacterium CG10_big_fil_rev_8_21_14_0_10_45_34]